MARRNFDWLAHEIEGLKRGLLAAGSAPQLGKSSFDSAPGQSIDEVNPETGYEVASFGTQFDGSHGTAVFTGPTPQTPSPAVYELGPGILAAGWDGIFCNADGVPDAAEAPFMDFTHVEVHVSSNSAHDPLTAEGLVGTINTVRGGRVSIPAEGVVYIWLVARSTSGKRSAPSAVVTVTVPPGGGDTTALEEELDAANERIDDAEDLINQANLKFTVSDTVPAGSGAVNGAVWWQKDATGIIGQWVWDAVETEWVPKGLAVTQVIPGGTMSSALVDQLFADVVVAKTAIADAFIGSSAIINGAVTATHITASEELSAKVASFLEVTAGMIDVGELWADSAWITEAQTLILTVLSHTNGEGYTSTITGQGLKVTRTVGGDTYDVIRLGTFGADYLSISNGAGKALTTITGSGDVSSQTLYVEGDAWANGRRLGDAITDFPRGEVAYASHFYFPPNIPSSWSTAAVAAEGVIEVEFTAERGRAYHLAGTVKAWFSGSSGKLNLHAIWRNGGLPVRMDTNDGRITPPANGVESAVMASNDYQNLEFGGRFVPLPWTSDLLTTKCRVLFYVQRKSSTAAVNIEYVTMRVTDEGFPSAPLYGQANGYGTSLIPTTTRITSAHAPSGVYNFQRGASSGSTVWTKNATITDRAWVGSLAGAAPWRSFIGVSTLYTELTGANVLDVESVKVKLTPTNFADAYGTLKLGLTGINASTLNSMNNGSGTYAPDNVTWMPETIMDLGAWPVNVERIIELPRSIMNLLRSGTQKYFTLGMTIPNSEIMESEYGMEILTANMSFITTYTKKV